MNKLNMIIAFFAIVAVILGFKLWHHIPNTDKSSGIHAVILSPPTAVSKFSLLDTKGKPFNNNSFWGHWNFILFGSASHSTVQQTESLGVLDKTIQLLQAHNQGPIPEVIFVSVDSTNDTLDKLNKYITGFNPKFMGVMGDSKQISALTQLVPAQDNSTRTVLLIDPAGKLSAIFPEPQHPDSVAKDFQLIVRNAG